MSRPLRRVHPGADHACAGSDSAVAQDAGGLAYLAQVQQIVASMEAVGLIEPLSVGKADKATGPLTSCSMGTCACWHCGSSATPTHPA